MRAIFFLIWPIVGCGPHAPLPSPIQSAVTAWQQAQMPPPRSGCLDGAEVERAKDMNDFLTRCQDARAASCLVYTPSDSMGRGGGWRMLLAPTQPVTGDGEPVIHETLHALYACSSLATVLEPYDSYHRDARIWKANGPGTVQERAEGIYEQMNSPATFVIGP